MKVSVLTMAGAIVGISGILGALPASAAIEFNTKAGLVVSYEKVMALEASVACVRSNEAGGCNRPVTERWSFDWPSPSTNAFVALTLDRTKVEGRRTCIIRVAGRQSDLPDCEISEAFNDPAVQGREKQALQIFLASLFNGPKLSLCVKVAPGIASVEADRRISQGGSVEYSGATDAFLKAFHGSFSAMAIKSKVDVQYPTGHFVTFVVDSVDGSQWVINEPHLETYGTPSPCGR